MIVVMQRVHSSLRLVGLLITWSRHWGNPPQDDDDDQANDDEKSEHTQKDHDFEPHGFERRSLHDGWCGG